ncbi:sensor histidine kinase [Stakelama sediminis]|uniref:sensor histidine kinase n=1 Tax=Stakelama sediminis TaxID=463200 RepID=UPI001C858050|nr:HAMP domain-containing sensor histidine kinase [Stakelama sediminis]
MLRSAAYRLSFFYTAACAIAILALGSGVYFAAQAAFQQQQDEDLSAEMRVLKREFKEGGRNDVIDAMTRRQASPNNRFLYALFDGDRRVAGSLTARRQPVGFSNFTFEDPEEGPDKARGLLMPLDRHDSLLVAIDTESLEALDRTILFLFTGAFSLVLLLGLIGATLLGRHLKRRLDRISETAGAIAAGDLSRRIVHSDRDDEFDRVDNALNAMLDRIVILLENLQQVSGDVAHDLRTPLARLRARIEAALAGPADPVRLREALESAMQQSDDLLGLFNAILRITEIEAGASRSAFQSLNLGELIGIACEMHAPSVEDSGRSLTWHAPADIRIFGDKELIMQAVSNLLDNAVHHTPENTRIEVGLVSADDRVSVSVCDNGPGVPDADLTRVVRRFVRLDRARVTDGHGLGLNLVAAIMQMHGGKLVLSDNGPGLSAELQFPLHRLS